MLDSVLTFLLGMLGTPAPRPPRGSSRRCSERAEFGLPGRSSATSPLPPPLATVNSEPWRGAWRGAERLAVAEVRFDPPGLDRASGPPLYPDRAGPAGEPPDVGGVDGGWGRSSVGRALESHSRGQGFDSPRLHQPRRTTGRGSAVQRNCLYISVTCANIAGHFGAERRRICGIPLGIRRPSPLALSGSPTFQWIPAGVGQAKPSNRR